MISEVIAHCTHIYLGNNSWHSYQFLSNIYDSVILKIYRLSHRYSKLYVHTLGFDSFLEYVVDENLNESTKYSETRNHKNVYRLRGNLSKLICHFIGWLQEPSKCIVYSSGESQSVYISSKRLENLWYNNLINSN